MAAPTGREIRYPLTAAHERRRHRFTVNPDGGGSDRKVESDAGPWNPPVETGAVAFPYTAYRCITRFASGQPEQARRGLSRRHEDGRGAGGEEPSSLVRGRSVVVGRRAVGHRRSNDRNRGPRFGDSPTNLDRVAAWIFVHLRHRRTPDTKPPVRPPAATYCYDAGGGTARSTVHPFVTAADASDIKVLVTGDTRTDPSVLTTIAARSPKDPTS